MNSEELFVYFENQRSDFIRILTSLVSHPTCSKDADDLNRFIDHLENLFQGFGPSVQRIPTAYGDILSLSFFQKEKERLVLLAHGDTVKVSDATLPVKIEGDKFFGNGCYDMKNGIALFYFFLKALHELGLSCHKQIEILCTPDEEIGSPASTPFLLKQCRGAKAVLLPEPCCPDGGVKIRRKGVALLRARLKGKAAHSGIEPEKGRDANRGLVRLVAQIDAMREKYPDVSFNPGIVSGGIGTNIVSPESCLEGEFRSYSNRLLKEVIKAMGTIRNVEDVEVDISVETHHPALEFDAKNRKLYTLAKKIADSFGYGLPSCSTGGASDGSTLSSAGIPVLDGLGMKGGGAHTPDEYIELSDFSYRAVLLTKLGMEI